MSTPNLTEALVRGNFDEARKLIKDGEKLMSDNYLENNKHQVFSNILRSKAFDLVDVLIKAGAIETDIYELDSFDRSFFNNIATSLKGDEESIAFLQSFLPKISSKNDEVKDQTVLGYCLDKAADPAVIQCFIDNGFDPAYKNNAERGLLHQVVNHRMLPEEKGLAYINILLSCGLDVNDKDIVGETSLIAAIKSRKDDYLDLLLQNGANPNELDKKGQSAFYYAAAEQFNPDSFRKLCEYGSPDYDIPNKDGVTLLGEFMRMMSGGRDDMKLLELLLQSGADLRQASPYYSQHKSGVDWLAEKPANVLQYVLEANAMDINGQDDKGNTLLHKVCAFNVNYEAEVAKELYRKVKLLLEAGADTAITNDKDETALMLAQQDNLKIKAVELLMRK